jgi:hypothetical protein
MGNVKRLTPRFTGLKFPVGHFRFGIPTDGMGVDREGAAVVMMWRPFSGGRGGGRG